MAMQSSRHTLAEQQQQPSVHTEQTADSSDSDDPLEQAAGATWEQGRLSRALLQSSRSPPKPPQINYTGAYDTGVPPAPMGMTTHVYALTVGMGAAGYTLMTRPDFQSAAQQLLAQNILSSMAQWLNIPDSQTDVLGLAEVDVGVGTATATLQTLITLPSVLSTAAQQQVCSGTASTG